MISTIAKEPVREDPPTHRLPDVVAGLEDLVGAQPVEMGEGHLPNKLLDGLFL